MQKVNHRFPHVFTLGYSRFSRKQFQHLFVKPWDYHIRCDVFTAGIHLAFAASLQKVIQHNIEEYIARYYVAMFYLLLQVCMEVKFF